MYCLGLTKMQRIFYPEGRRDFSRAMEIDSKNTDAIVKLGDIDLVYYVADSRGNKALLTDLKELTQQLLKRDPKSFDGLRFSCYISLMDNDLKMPIQKYDTATQIKPDNPHILTALVP